MFGRDCDSSWNSFAKIFDYFAFTSVRAGLIAVVGLALGWLFRRKIPEGVEYYCRALSAGLFVYSITLLLGDLLGLETGTNLAVIADRCYLRPAVLVAFGFVSNECGTEYSAGRFSLALGGVERVGRCFTSAAKNCSITSLGQRQ
jgi:hypothetical protein